MKNLRLRILDRYIMRKFIFTFLGSIVMIVGIIIIFDISEHIDDFVSRQAPLKAIVLDFYLNLIPYYVNMFSPLFVFITVIIFTSRMAANSEFIAILSCGISFRRLLLPYMLSALMIFALSLSLNHFVIPRANVRRIQFEDKYIKDSDHNFNRNIHYQISPGEFAYVESFSNWNNTAYKFTLEKVEGKPEERIISTVALRSMQQARYSELSLGHFGLAARYYTHFTSPIRRYPDLQIHRIIKEQLRGRLKAERVEHYRDILPEVAKHSSEMERRADEAERETDKLKKVEYMEQHIGEEYEGVISGVTGWGLYVELPNTVEGLIHISTIPGDYYHYNEAACEMVGEATGRCFKLGMPVRIEVEDCDRFMRTINFRLVDK